MARSLVWQLTLSLAAVAILTIAPAFLQGRFANRWEVPGDLVGAADALARFPMQLGPWEAADPAEPLKENEIQELGLAGYVSRYYRHRESGEDVLLLLMVGQPGRLVRHTPDYCYGNRGNTLLDEARLKVAPEAGKPLPQGSEFRVLKYQPESPLRDPPFRVAYGFTTDGTWAVPKLPRLTYGAYPALYKVEIVAREPAAATGLGELPIEDFVRQFVPAFADFAQTQRAAPQ